MRITQTRHVQGRAARLQADFNAVDR